MTKSILFLNVLLLAGTASADVKLKAAYSAAGQTTDYTIYLTNNRERFEYGTGATIIRQRDTHRLLDIDDAAKSYVVMPLDPAAPPPSASEKKGGVVNVTTTVVDTGERKPMFGYEARHLKTTVITASGPGACEQVQQKMETDGWYIAIDYPSAPERPETAHAGCRDEYRYQQIGEAKLGYPVSYVTKTTSGKEESTITMEVKELSSDPLPASLFEPPAGYSEKKNLDEVVAARPKTAGIPRVGVAPVNDQSGHSLPADPMNTRLRSTIASAGMQPVPLNSLANAEDEAKKAQCDYILYSDVSQISKSVAGQITGKVGRLGSMLSRSKTANTADGSEATVNFRLMQVGQTEPALASTASGKNGSALNLKTAIQLASMLTPMGLMAHAYGGQGFGMLASHLLANSSADPGLGGIASLFAQTSSAAQAIPSSPELTAVSAALENEGKMVAAKVKGN